MRDLQVSLNQTQRVRLQSALQQLQDLSPSSGAAATVAVADSIPVNLEDGVLKFWNFLSSQFCLLLCWITWLLMLSHFVRVVRGHGTAEADGQLVATLCGVVERVNKLVYVRTLRARYKPEIGDIIIGRVIEVAPKRWRLEINFSQDAVLLLSSMNLPDGIQRRRTAVDELNMRSFFEENDVICAEVRGFQHDGSVQLQARSQKYGKLERGQLLTVPPYLVKRRKQHYHHLEDYGVDLIIGCNGYIWVGEHIETRENDMVEDQDNHLEKDGNSNLKQMDDQDEEETFTSVETRRLICRIANAVRLLSALGFTLSLEAIIDTVELSSASNISIKDMLAAEFYVQTAEREVQRRVSKSRKKA